MSCKFPCNSWISRKVHESCFPISLYQFHREPCFPRSSWSVLPSPSPAIQPPPEFAGLTSRPLLWQQLHATPSCKPHRIPTKNYDESCHNPPRPASLPSWIVPRNEYRSCYYNHPATTETSLPLSTAIPVNSWSLPAPRQLQIDGTDLKNTTNKTVYPFPAMPIQLYFFVIHPASPWRSLDLAHSVPPLALPAGKILIVIIYISSF